MADVFLSYAREDRAKAHVIADALASRGLSVWWDRLATPGVPFDREIEDQLEQARCVLVLWSGTSIESAWVKNEAMVAAERGVLLPVLLESVRPPLAFRHLHAAEIGDVAQLTASDVWRALVERILAQVPMEAQEPPSTLETTIAPPFGILQAVSGNLTGCDIPIPAIAEVFAIGRDADSNSFAIDDQTVSRRHAEIRVISRRAMLKDLDSSAGTFVNGSQVTTCVLREGDRIRFGAESVFLFSTIDPSAAILETVAVSGSTEAAIAGEHTATLVQPDLGLYVVVDSLSPADDVAAAIALETAGAFIQDTQGVSRDGTWPFPYDPSLSLAANRLSVALRLIDHRLLVSSESVDAPLRVGLTAVLASPPYVYVGGLGRSQCYMFRRDASPTLLFDLRIGTPLIKRTYRSLATDALRNEAQFGGDISALHISEHRVGEGDLILLTSQHVASVVVTARDRMALLAEDSIDAAVAEIQESAKTVRADPFHFVMIQVCETHS